MPIGVSDGTKFQYHLIFTGGIKIEHITAFNGTRTSDSASFVFPAGTLLNPIWVRVTWVNSTTTITYQYSVDGFNWNTLFTSSSPFLTPTLAGFATYGFAGNGTAAIPATMAFNNASGIGNTEGFRKSWTASGGSVVANVVYEPNRPSYRSELQEVLRSKPDVIVTGSYLADTTIILREWYQSGQPARWIIPGWAANGDLIKALGPDVTEGIISVESICAENSPAYKSFADRFAKETKMAAQDNVYAAMTYDEVIVLALAVQAVGPNAAADVLAKKVHELGTAGGTVVSSFAEGKKLLVAGKRVTYSGASSALNFDEFNDVTPDFAASFVEKGKLVRKYVVKL